MAETKEVQEKKPTVSEVFIERVVKQFEAELGNGVDFTDYERTLAQHLYIKVDASLKALEAERQNSNPPIEWTNVNMGKLALDAVHRIMLGLDALMDNHLHVIPYLNGKTNKYDVDLRIGYKGEDFIRRKLALFPPKDIIYHLVHENDFFAAHVKSLNNPYDTYEFQINQPFDRGQVIGGFGYIMYEDQTKNTLVTVSMRDFEKSKKAAKSKKFWGAENYEEEMLYKTLVHRVAKKIQLDPQKINTPTYTLMAASTVPTEEIVQAEIERNANTEIIDIMPAEVVPEEISPAAAAEEKAAQQVVQENMGPGF